MRKANETDRAVGAHALRCSGLDPHRDHVEPSRRCRDDVSQVAQFLLDHAGDVLDGCEGTATTVSELEGVSDDHAILLLRAVDAYRAGFTGGSSAGYGDVGFAHLTRIAGTDFINRMKKSPGGVDPTPESDVAQLYARADWGPAIAAYQNGRDNDYGRNQTIHHASLAQYSAVNGLRCDHCGDERARPRIVASTLPGTI